MNGKTTGNSETARRVRLRPEWLALLGEEFEQDYMRDLSQFLRERRKEGARIYPPAGEIFRAFDATSPEAVRVVILGQDPYHNPGQAHGLCFSVLPGVPVPPSLQNIYRELQSDLGLAPSSHGYLMNWATQGVLLLNSVLTVEHNQPGSHQKRGWERFTDRVVAVLNDFDRPLVFMLWGAYAQRKGAGIDDSRHLVLTAPHPSPLSAHRGFLGCGHFSQANAFIAKNNGEPIQWGLPPSALTAPAQALP